MRKVPSISGYELVAADTTKYLGVDLSHVYLEAITLTEQQRKLTACLDS
jgi:hypothetical protein